ncbi:MAG: hypothetical protein ACRCV9_16350 [Burkholderiaceae bacterium]
MVCKLESVKLTPPPPNPSATQADPFHCSNAALPLATTQRFAPNGMLAYALGSPMAKSFQNSRNVSQTSEL